MIKKQLHLYSTGFKHFLEYKISSNSELDKSNLMCTGSDSCDIQNARRKISLHYQ